MENEFICLARAELEREGYLIKDVPTLPDAQALLYASSQSPIQLGFARVDDHFFFIDGEGLNPVTPRQLVETYKRRSSLVNLAVKVPHALRVRLPNLAVVVVSPVGFTDETIQFVRSTYMNPWYGGESGQFILVDIEKKKVITHRPPARRQPGAYPLNHTVEIIQSICLRALKPDQPPF